jgi:hypothetical protein
MPAQSGELSSEEVAERLVLRVETRPTIIRLGGLPGRRTNQAPSRDRTAQYNDGTLQ